MPIRNLLLSIVLLASCSGGKDRTGAIISIDTLASGAVHVVSAPEGEWALSGAEPWRLVEDLRIGVVEGDQPYMFGSARNVIPDPAGRIWVLDSQAHELRLFDQQGEFIRVVGGEGEGPGEFGFNPCAFPGPEGEIWVEAGGRWQRFDTAGVLLGGQQVTRLFGCAIRSWLPDGRFVAADRDYEPDTGEPGVSFLVHSRDPSGAVVVSDTVRPPAIPEPEEVRLERTIGRGTMIVAVPLSHVPGRFLGPNGDFWITEGHGDYRIRRQTLFGDTLVIIERPYDPIPVPDSLRDEEIAGLHRENYRLESGFDLSQVPRVFPPFDRFHVGRDGTLWVRRQVAGGVYILDVFAQDGRFLGPVEVPSDFGRMIIHHITQDHMYGRVRDELDVSYAVRLRILRPDG